jgi:hypothetical protein
MINIDNILLEEEVLDSYFTCDLEKCKGACCTFPGRYGAPLLDEEIDKIYDNFNEIKNFLNDKSIDYINRNGYYEGGRGDYSTMCIDREECVFVYYENSIARCAIEKAYNEGLSSFQKPLSCHLFPIRVADTGRKYLYYKKIAECVPGKKKGLQEKTKLSKSLQDALSRAYGEEWYRILEEYANSQKYKKKSIFSFGGVNETVA